MEIRSSIPLVYWEDGSWAWFQQTPMKSVVKVMFPFTVLCLPSPASSPLSTLIQLCKRISPWFYQFTFLVFRIVYPLCQLISSKFIACRIVYPPWQLISSRFASCPSPATNWPPKNLAWILIVLMSCPNGSLFFPK